MKTIYILLLLSLNCIANAVTPKVSVKVSSPFVSLLGTTNPVKPNPRANTISGLKIVSYDSQKYGKMIFIVSDMYTLKEVSFFNKKGKKVFNTASVGSPIYLSKFKKGDYTIMVVEENKTEMKDFTIN